MSAVRAGTTGLAAAGRRLVLWCPDWPVRAAVWGSGTGFPLRLSDPLALVAKGEVHACSSAARALGVRRLLDAERDVGMREERVPNIGTVRRVEDRADICAREALGYKLEHALYIRTCLEPK